jgi:rRNA processing protein Gar1
MDGKDAFFLILAGFIVYRIQVVVTNLQKRVAKLEKRLGPEPDPYDAIDPFEQMKPKK